MELIHQIVRNIQTKSSLSPETRYIAQRSKSDIDAQIDFAAFILSVNKIPDNIVDLSKASPSQKKRFFKLMEEYCADNLIDYSAVTNKELKQLSMSKQIETLEKKIDLLPDKAGAYSRLGDIYLAKGMPAEAVANFLKSLEIKADDASLHGKVGSIFMQTGQSDKAVTHFNEALRITNEALRIDPKSSADQRNKGFVLLRLGKLDEAIDVFQKLSNINKDQAEVYIILGFAYDKKGKVDLAIENYKKALELEPDQPEVLNNLGSALKKRGRLNEAIKQWQKALRLAPGSPKLHYMIGSAFTEQGNFAEAIMHFRKALQIRGNWIGPMNDLAWLLATQPQSKFHDPTQAIELAERACKLTNYQQPGLLDTLAVAYSAAGEFPKAVATAEKALELARSSRQEQFAEQIQIRLKLYKAGQSYSEPLPKTRRE